MSITGMILAAWLCTTSVANQPIAAIMFVGNYWAEIQMEVK